MRQPNFTNVCFRIFRTMPHINSVFGNIFTEGLFGDAFLWDKGSQASVWEAYFKSKDCAVQGLTNTLPSVKQNETDSHQSLPRLVTQALLPFCTRLSIGWKPNRGNYSIQVTPYALCSPDVCVCVCICVRSCVHMLGRPEENFKCHFSEIIYLLHFGVGLEPTYQARLAGH